MTFLAHLFAFHSDLRTSKIRNQNTLSVKAFQIDLFTSPFLHIILNPTSTYYRLIEHGILSSVYYCTTVFDAPCPGRATPNANPFVRQQ